MTILLKNPFKNENRDPSFVLMKIKWEKIHEAYKVQTYILPLSLVLLSHGKIYSEIYFIIINNETGMFTLTQSLVKTSLEYGKDYHVLGWIILF